MSLSAAEDHGSWVTTRRDSAEDEKEFLIVEQFINMLKTNARFSDDFKTIKFKGSERDLSRGQEIFKFTIEAELNKKSKRKLRRKK